MIVLRLFVGTFVLWLGTMCYLLLRFGTTGIHHQVLTESDLIALLVFAFFLAFALLRGRR